MASISYSSAVLPFLFLLCIIPFFPVISNAAQDELFSSEVYSTTVHRHYPSSPVVSPSSASPLSSKMLSPPAGVSDIPLRNIPGVFAVNITVGTPPQPFTVQLDTGSSTLAIPSTGCLGCGSRNRLYSAAASSSAQPLPCSDPSCTLCSPDGSACFFQVTYGDGSGINGTLVTDVVNFGPYSTPSTFGQFKYSSPGFEQYPVDGILGIAYAVLDCTPSCQAPVFDAAVSDGNPPLNNIFSLCLSSPFGVFSMGGVDPQYIAPSATIQYTPITVQQYYSIYMSDLKTNGASIGLSATTYQQVIVDSGTTLLLFGQNVFPSVYNAIQNACNSALYASLCNGIQSGNYFSTTPQAIASLPSLTFVFGQSNPISVTIPPSNYIRSDLGGPSGFPYAFAIASSGSSMNILGDTFMMNQVIVFDRANARLGFAPGVNCGSSLPQIYSVSPATITNQFNTIVTISGSGFLAANGGNASPAPVVYLSNNVNCTNAAIVSDSLITCTYKAGSAGSSRAVYFPYVVLNSGSVYAANSPISIQVSALPSISTFYPSVGTNTIPIALTLHGYGFTAPGFNISYQVSSSPNTWLPCSNTTISSDSTSVCVIPANTLTSQSQSLNLRAGFLSNFTSSSLFTPTTQTFAIGPPPVITSMSPSTVVITSQPSAYSWRTINLNGANMGNQAADVINVFYSINGSVPAVSPMSIYIFNSLVVCQLPLAPFWPLPAGSSNPVYNVQFMIQVGNQNSTLSSRSVTVSYDFSSPAPNNRLGEGAIAGIAIGSAMFVALVIVLYRFGKSFFWNLRASLNKDNSDDGDYLALQEVQEVQPTAPYYPAGSQPSVQQQQQQQPYQPVHVYAAAAAVGVANSNYVAPSPQYAPQPQPQIYAPQSQTVYDAPHGGMYNPQQPYAAPQPASHVAQPYYTAPTSSVAPVVYLVQQQPQYVSELAPQSQYPGAPPASQPPHPMQQPSVYYPPIQNQSYDFNVQPPHPLGNL